MPTLDAAPVSLWLSLQCPECSRAIRVRRAMAEDGLDCPFCDAPVDVAAADFEPTEKPIKTPKRSKRAKKKKQKKAQEKHTLSTNKEKKPKPSRRKEDKTTPLNPETPPTPENTSGPIRIPLENRPKETPAEILFNPPKTKKAVLPPPRIQETPAAPPTPTRSTPPLAPSASSEPPRESLKSYLKPVPRRLDQDGKSVKLKLKVDTERPAARAPIPAISKHSPISAPVDRIDEPPETYRFERPIPTPTKKASTTEREGFRKDPSTLNQKNSRLYDFVSSPKATLGLAFTFAISVSGALAIMLLTGEETANEGLEKSKTNFTAASQLTARHTRIDELEGLLKNWETEKTAELARRFMLTDTRGERLFLVRDAERVRPLMEQWEAENPFRKMNLGKILLSKVIEEDDSRFIVLALETDDGGHHFVAGEAFDETVLLDWEFCVRYQPMSLEQFKRDKPQHPVPFRVKLKEGDYYNYEFSDNLVYQSVRLTYPGTDFLLHGFIDRTAPFANDLITEVLFDQPSFIVNLRYPKNAKSDNCVEITGVEHRSWFR
ncbi:MAG: hypothetical protein AAGA58_14435 [Verrucomicrobiota bacterium]